MSRPFQVGNFLLLSSSPTSSFSLTSLVSLTSSVISNQSGYQSSKTSAEGVVLVVRTLFSKFSHRIFPDPFALCDLQAFSSSWTYTTENQFLILEAEKKLKDHEK